MSLHQDAVSVLTAWRPPEPGQDQLRQAYLGFLAARPDACQRSCAAGHITASALVLSPDRERVLLTLHPRVGRWLQLGGHCEPEDDSLCGAALREATEESGLPGLRIEPMPVYLGCHPITCSLGVPTRHFDVVFVVRAPERAAPVRSAESLDLRWWPVDDLPPDDDELATIIRSAVPQRAGQRS